jgi:hypothetical protein
MGSDENEFRLDDYNLRPVRMTVSNQVYRNAVGIGFTMKLPGSDLVYAADLSSLVFRRVEVRPTIHGPGFRTDIPVDIDTLDRTLPYLVELSGNGQLYQVSESERKAVSGHVEDLREVTRAMIEMQRVIIGRTKVDA